MAQNHGGLTNRDTTPSVRLALCGLLAAASLAVFWSTRHHEFINFDDPDYVSANPKVVAGVTMDSLRWAFTQAHVGNWHPVTWLSHMLDCQFFGPDPGAHHLVNVGFHAANVVLLFLLLVNLTGATWRSAVVAGLFALHPLHVESVAWIAERKDLLSAFFGLLTLLAYVRYVRALPSQSGKARLAYGLALLCFALGLMSKPMLVTWPCVMLLLDVWPLGRGAQGEGSEKRLPFLRDWRRLVIEKLPFFALSVASSVVTVIGQRGAGATATFEALPFHTRLAQLPASYLRYLGKTFWPENLAVFYPYEAATWDAPLTLAGVALLLGASAFVARQLRRRPFLAVGWFWFLGTLVPVIGLVQVGSQSIADRYTYLPHIGLFVALVWLAAEVLERWKIPRFLRATSAAGLLAVLGILTSRQVGHWRNSLTLARHATQATTGNYVAHAQLATALVLEGKLDEAFHECQRALQIRPDYAEAHNTVGMIRIRQEQYDEAVASYREAARYAPTNPEAFHGLADVYFRQGRLAEAEQTAREAVRLWPMHVGALLTLASVLHTQGKLDDAIVTYRRLLALKPGVFSIHRSLGGALASRGDLTEAAAEFERALEIQPHHPDALNSLGLVRLTQGHVEAASNCFSRALSAQPTNAIAHYQIALLLTAACQPAQAVPHYRATLLAQPDLPDALNNLAWLLATSAEPSLRDGNEAVRLAERACALTGHKEPLLLGTLAATYAEAERFDEAAATAEKAIAIAQAAGQTEIVERNRQLLELYRAGKPFHETQ